MIQVPLVQGAPLVEACFVSRPNTFLVEATLTDGTLIQAHLADRGRLLTKLVPNARLLLGYKPAPKRKTAYQVAGVFLGDELVSLDTLLPNRLVAAALKARALAPFATYGHMEAEVRVGASRFDFGLAEQPPALRQRWGAAIPCLVEVKSVGDIQGDVAIFPDAPTSRGRRHLLELAALRTSGQRTAVVLIVQRNQGTAVAINRQIDPQLADTLADVVQRGVEVYAYRCPLTPKGIQLGPAIPVHI